MKQKLPLLILICLFISSCGGGGTVGKKQPRYPHQADQLMTDAFNRGEQFYKNRQFNQAMTVYEQYVNNYPYNRLSDEAYYKMGKIQFLRSNWDGAISTFNLLSSKSPDPEYVAKGYYMSGYTAYKKGDHTSAESYFSKIAENDLSPKFMIHKLSLQIDIAQKKMAPKSQLDYFYLRLMDMYKSGSQLSNLEAPNLVTEQQASDRLRTFIVSPLDATQIPEWFRNYPEGYSRPYVLYKWGKTYFEASRSNESRDILNRFVQAYPKHEYVSMASKLLSQMGGSPVMVPVDGNAIKIGVLLPLSGSQAAYSQSILWGIDCALGRKDGCTGGSYTIGNNPQSIQLLVRNSGSTDTEVYSAVDGLVAENVSAIIGPLSGPLSEAAAKRAQELKVVIMPITQKEGIMSLGQWVFQMGYKTQAQMKDLAGEAKVRGIRSVGIFYPNIAYGKEMATQFEAAAKELGLRILAKATYTPGTDLSSDTRKLKQNLSQLSGSGSTGLGALFVPDSYRTLTRLPQALDFASMKGIPLLGTNAWNDPAATLDESHSGSFFRDIFYAGSQDELTAGFVNAYRTAFGKAPTSLEALGFDSIRFLQQSIQIANSADTSKVRDTLAASTTLRGITKITGFLAGQGPIINSITLGIGPSGVFQQ